MYSLAHAIHIYLDQIPDHSEYPTIYPIYLQLTMSSHTIRAHPQATLILRNRLVKLWPTIKSPVRPTCPIGASSPPISVKCYVPKGTSAPMLLSLPLPPGEPLSVDFISLAHFLSTFSISLFNCFAPFSSGTSLLSSTFTRRSLFSPLFLPPPILFSSAEAPQLLTTTTTATTTTTTTITSLTSTRHEPLSLQHHQLP